MNRAIDKMGRIVIPKEMCKTLNIKTGDKLFLDIKDNSLVIQKKEERNIVEYIHNLLRSDLSGDQQAILIELLKYIEGQNESI